MKAWINLYASGHYHRLGKRNTMNLHPGDMYATEEAAKADIDKEAPYLGTVAVDIPANITGVRDFPGCASPIPLSKTRGNKDYAHLQPKPQTTMVPRKCGR